MLTPQCLQLLEEFYAKYGNAEAVKKDPDLSLYVFLYLLKEETRRIDSILMDIGQPEVVAATLEWMREEEAEGQKSS